MMKKLDWKVIKIEAVVNETSLLEIHAAVPVDSTVADLCKENNLPILSVYDIHESGAMTEEDACKVAALMHIELEMNPYTPWIDGTGWYFKY